MPIKRVRSCKDSKHARGILDGGGYRAEMCNRAERAERVGGHQPKCRFEAEHAAKRSGNADGAAAVRSEVEGAQPQCRRDRGAPARAAGGFVLVPWVTRDARQGRVADGLPSKFGR